MELKPRLRLDAKACISCGICMDLCPPRAIDMARSNRVGMEGAVSLLKLLEPQAPDPEPGMTFPFLAAPQLCPVCKICEAACPTAALVMQWEGSCTPLNP